MSNKLQQFLNIKKSAPISPKTFQSIPFEWKTYLAKYPDLIAAGITTKEAAIIHWNSKGKAEGRTDKLEYVEFDWQTYIAKYPDLSGSGITTQEAALNHWVSTGKAEGRNDKVVPQTIMRKTEWRTDNVAPQISQTVMRSRTDNVMPQNLPTIRPHVNQTVSTDTPFILPTVTPTNIIPRVIYQTWETKVLPDGMSSAVQTLMDAHPNFKHVLVDARERREFIKTYYPIEVLYAYDSLIPGAYQSDLWRYCVLYLNGGIYIDIKFVPVNGFSLESIIDSEHYVLDCKVSQPKSGVSVANGFIISYPGNNALKACIYKICSNTVNKLYGSSPLEPSGPWLLGKYISKVKCTIVNGFDKLLLNNKVIFDMYESYRTEQFKTTKHYSIYWNERAIYNMIDFLEYSIIQSAALPYVNTKVIPKNIFQTWKSADIPTDMRSTINSNKTSFPDYTFYLYSDAMCADFIFKYYNETVVHAFNTIIPGAFKADLWRYCVLYVYGGIYIDIKYKLLHNIDLNTMIKQEHFVRDRPVHFKNGNGIYNGFMIVKPRNRYLLQAIARIVKNVRTRYYGYNALYPTGPGLLGEIIPTTYNFSLTYDDIGNSNAIFMNGMPILQSYVTYRTEQKTVTSKSYDVHWRELAIYTVPASTALRTPNGMKNEGTYNSDAPLESTNL